MKIIVLDAHGVNPGDLSWDRLSPLGDVEIYEETADGVNEQATIDRIGDSEIVVTCKNVLGRKTFEECKHLKMVAVLSTGFDVVDVKAAAEHGVKVCNVPTYATDAVAQFTFALILELCHAVGNHDRSVHAGDWCNCGDFCYWLSPQVELSGKTLGIIGYGNIGKRVAAIGSAFGMKVVVNSPHAPESVSLDELFAKADVISLNCCLTENNRDLISAASIAKMKDGVWLVNTARGPLVNEPDLVAALECGKVGGYASDVVTGEPISPENPLLKAKNCILTPHIAWSTKECRKRLVDVTADNIKAFLDGNPINVVN